MNVASSQKFLKYVPDSFIDTLVVQFNDLMRTGQVPTDWRKTSFKMLPKTRFPSEYRPIATIRLFCKLFAYMILGRVEAQLETHQPEEQHGFRGGRRVEEQFGDYALSLGQTFQRKRANLDCQPGLVEGFRPSTLASTMARSFGARPFRNTLIWMIQNLYRNQPGGKLLAAMVAAGLLIYTVGVRQGCVLSPGCFVRCWKCPMANWRDEMEHLGLDLRDGGRSLLDLRFADDILIFGTDYHVHWRTFRQNLLKTLPQWGLQLNAQKTKIPHNAGPTTVTTATAEWIDHISS